MSSPPFCCFFFGFIPRSLLPTPSLCMSATHTDSMSFPSRHLAATFPHLTVESSWTPLSSSPLLIPHRSFPPTFSDRKDPSSSVRRLPLSRSVYLSRTDSRVPPAPRRSVERLTPILKYHSDKWMDSLHEESTTLSAFRLLEQYTGPVALSDSEKDVLHVLQTTFENSSTQLFHLASEMMQPYRNPPSWGPHVPIAHVVSPRHDRPLMAPHRRVDSGFRHKPVTSSRHHTPSQLSVTSFLPPITSPRLDPSCPTAVSSSHTCLPGAVSNSLMELQTDSTPPDYRRPCLPCFA